MAINKIDEEEVADVLESPSKISAAFLMEENEASFDAAEVKVEVE